MAVTLQDLADGTHPTDAGYDTIAEVFYSGIHAATSLGYITQPSNVNPSVPLSGPD
jgi:phospholipase/lecithinase/hemolysin